MAIGFGARNLVTDFLSGVFMILEDQYGVGDTIDAGVASGEVIEVGLRVTKLRGDNGEIWYVRNGEVKRIGNLSQGWATAGVDVTVRAVRGPGPGPRGDQRGRRDDEQGGALERAPVGPGRGPRPGRACCWTRWSVRVSAKTMPGKALAVERELRWRIKQAFDAAGIRIVGGAPGPRGGGPGRRPDGGDGGPVGVRVDDVAAVDGGDADRAAGEHGEVRGRADRRGGPGAGRGPSPARRRKKTQRSCGD